MSILSRSSLQQPHSRFPTLKTKQNTRLDPPPTLVEPGQQLILERATSPAARGKSFPKDIARNVLPYITLSRFDSMQLSRPSSLARPASRQTLLCLLHLNLNLNHSRLSFQFLRLTIQTSVLQYMYPAHLFPYSPFQDLQHYVRPDHIERSLVPTIQATMSQCYGSADEHPVLCFTPDLGDNSESAPRAALDSEEEALRDCL
ncbi:hypothetical protein BV20DRAFT_1056539 [Pilatotrama ljubarskyi]|nr:hypothetical protein BV20DRAFT_1056539 [Pilatotrama ljubarskyi]